FLSYLQRYRDLRDLHSFPTRRSSDLFELGLFEDDDYLLRLEQAGFRVVCADDVLVHHFGQATIGALANGSYGDLFHANRRRFQRSEEHTSELQSLAYLVCRLLLEKKT